MKIIGRKVLLLRNPVIEVSTVFNKPFHVSIPFINHKTNYDIKKEVRKLVPEYYAQLSLRIKFTKKTSRFAVSLISTTVFVPKCSINLFKDSAATTIKLHT